MNIVIPLAGKGQRFKDAEFTTPKPLINVFNKEILFHVLDNLCYDKNDIIFILYGKELSSYDFETILKKKYPYIQLLQIEKETKGAAETLFIGLSKILTSYKYNKKCLVIDGDTFYTEDVVKKFRDKKQNNAVFYTVNKDKNPIYSYIKINDNNQILEIKEKEKISDNANTGAYGFEDIKELYNFSKIIVENNIRFQNEPYISCIIDIMIKQEKKFEAIGLNSDFVHVLGTPKQLMEFKKSRFAFLFDLDGTLIISDDIYFNIWKSILKEYNIYLTFDIFKNFIQGNSDITVMRNLLPFTEVQLENISERKDYYFQNNLEKIIIIPGAVEFIKLLKKLGHQVAIVTNCNRGTAEKILENIGIHSIIDHLVIGSECAYSKPFPDPYLKACELFGIQSEDAIIFEDSKSGILSGRTTTPKCLVGITSVYDYESLLNIGVNMVIDNYENIDVDSFCNYTLNKNEFFKQCIKNSLKNVKIKKIKIFSDKLKGGYIADIVKVKIITETNEILDSVMKLENKNDTNLSNMAHDLDLYQREYYFYESISKYINIPLPQFYGLVKNDDLETIGILLEDINKDKFKLNLNLNNESISVSLSVIDNLVKLHTQFWNKELQTTFPFLSKNNASKFNPSWTDYITKNWDTFKSIWKCLLSEKQIDVGNKIVRNFQKIQNSLSQKPLTLCHGDVKSGNIFFKEIAKDNYIPYFIDWQYIANGKGVQDVVFFLIESFDCDIMHIYTPIIKNYYYAMLLKSNIKDYSYEEYNTDFINSICYYPFFVAIWFGVTPEDDLIDKNFPYFFIKKLFGFIDLYVPDDFFSI